MNHFMKHIVGINLMAIGLLSMSVGVFRQEHKTVAKKSNIICLECIGIG